MKAINLSAILALLTLRAAAQTLNLAESADYATFKADSGKVLIEFYVALQKSRLPFISVSDTLSTAQISFTLSAVGKDAELTTARQFLSLSENPATAEDGLLLTRLTQVLEPNIYDFTITAESGSEKPFSAVGRFNRIKLRSFDSDSLRLSDIQLAFNCYKSDRNDAPFYKNALEVIPNPTAIFGSSQPSLYAYLEIYNLVRNLRLSSDSLYQRTYISRNDAAMEETERRKVRRRASDAMMFIEKTSLDSLLSGKYAYHFELCDSSFKPIVARKKSFFIYNPNVKPEMVARREESQFDNEFAGATEELLDEMREQIDYIITGDEKDAYKTATTLQQKQNFFERFWIVRGGASARRTYMSKVEQANQRYSQGSLRGFKSDRGRVLIKYGEPQNIERENASNNQKPYETWQYENLPGQGSVIFIFADRMGFGRYELIHSTAIGEIFNQNWQQNLNQTNTARGNNNGF